MVDLKWVLLLLLTSAIVGCGGAEGEGKETTSQQASSPPAIKEVTHTEALKVVRRTDAKITVVNFWATWCVPCVEEFPAFVRLDREMDARGVDVMFISTDFPDQKEKAIEFLSEHGITGTSYLKTGNTTAFVNGFSEEWTGAVPATFIYDDQANLLDFWEGKVSYEELKRRVATHLDEA